MDPANSTRDQPVSAQAKHDVDRRHQVDLQHRQYQVGVTPTAYLAGQMDDDVRHHAIANKGVVAEVAVLPAHSQGSPWERRASRCTVARSLTARRHGHVPMKPDTPVTSRRRPDSELIGRRAYAAPRTSAVGNR
jgi:hypothetical protein